MVHNQNRANTAWLLMPLDWSSCKLVPSVFAGVCSVAYSLQLLVTQVLVMLHVQLCHLVFWPRGVEQHELSLNGWMT